MSCAEGKGTQAVEAPHSLKAGDCVEAGEDLPMVVLAGPPHTQRLLAKHMWLQQV